MQQSQLLSPQHLYLEFGAGRGKFLHFIASALGADAPGPFIALDRDSSRRKADRFHKEQDFQRVRMDIEHFALARYPLPPGRALVACSKHLCGAATGEEDHIYFFKKNRKREGETDSDREENQKEVEFFFK